MFVGYYRFYFGKLGRLDERRMGLERRRLVASGFKVIEIINN